MSAGLWNQQVRDNLRAIGNAWTAFTPTHSGSWTTGNGTLEGLYIKAGHLIHAKVKFTYGLTSSASGNFGLVLPWTHDNGSIGGGAGDGLPVGRAVCFDTSASASTYRDALVNGSTLRMVDASGMLVTATVPFTPANGDIYSAFVRFESTT
jgi:hypothetical protein